MSVMQVYGDKQEKDVAFHLRRAFKDSKNVRVFHDLRFQWEGENAQIDHLVLHNYGFIVIESKSIQGEVRVNEHREWSRSYRNNWSGLPSPIQQALNQIKILKMALGHNKTRLLGKMLGLQQGFGGRKYDVLIAVSSSAIIHRTDMPADVSRLIVKSEFIPEQVSKIIKGHGGLLTGNPAFDKDDLPAIAEFLASHQSDSRIESAETQTAAPAASLALNVKKLADFTNEEWQARCKHCDNTQNLEGKWGKFGYYVVCPLCQKNTPLKRACPKCQADTKLSKNKSVFSLSCLACGDVGRIVLG